MQLISDVKPLEEILSEASEALITKDVCLNLSINGTNH
jgi:hypothetical protein